MDLSMDEFLLKSGDFVAWKVIVHSPLSISRVSKSGEMIFWRDEVFDAEFFFLKVTDSNNERSIDLSNYWNTN